MGLSLRLRCLGFAVIRYLRLVLYVFSANVKRNSTNYFAQSPIAKSREPAYELGFIQTKVALYAPCH